MHRTAASFRGTRRISGTRRIRGTHGIRRLLEATALMCVLAGPSRPAHAQEKFSLSMFHFNVQYVAGGLIGFPDGESNTAQFNLDNDQVEDRIITQSFEPALDLLLAHPTWKLTLELQGLMVEVMQARHPTVLDKLRQLVDGGQVELVSFHYSDELFLAYPRLDIMRSHERLDAVMAAAGLTLSPVVFCQEGQFGEGIAQVAPAHGQTILGLPKNLFRYQHDDLFDTAAPLYELDGEDIVLIGRSVDASEVQVSWSFFGDGELWSTGDQAPYMGTHFTLDASSVAEYEAKLAGLEAQGYRIATISEYVAYAKAAGVEQRPLPPMLDGTWQPSSSDSMFRWMGKSGALDVLLEFERDNEVLTTNVEARHAILAAEALLTWAREQGLVAQDEYPEGLTPCWIATLLGRVTDATGINPWIAEVAYGLDHGRDALACARAISEEVLRRSGARRLRVDTGSGAVERDPPGPSDPLGTFSPSEPFLTETDRFSVDAPRREVTVTWETADATPTLHRLTIQAGPAENGLRNIEVRFPLNLDEYRLTPGLVEGEVRTYPKSAFSFEQGRISIPLGNGLLGLGDNLWLIKHTRKVHVAVTLYDDQDTVSFRDETLDADGSVTWVFYLLEGSEAEALALAERLNLWPVEMIENPDGAPKNDEGCSCSADGAGPGHAPLLLLLLLLLGLALPLGRRLLPGRRRARVGTSQATPWAGCDSWRARPWP